MMRALAILRDATCRPARFSIRSASAALLAWARSARARASQLAIQPPSSLTTALPLHVLGNSVLRSSVLRHSHRNQLASREWLG
eukprot:6209082-Pleurochrysis_carterae.AAC.2